MFVETLNKNFPKSTPIFANEIESIFNNYTKAYIYRLINNALNRGDLALFSRGVYYLPKKTKLGVSLINSFDVINKKYIKNNDEIYGIISGLSLLNKFGFTTQITNLMEIITNKESTRKRVIKINNMKYILRKSRYKIDQKNYATYTILELFNIIKDDTKISEYSLNLIKNYINENSILLNDIIKYSSFFPAKVLSAIMRKIYGTL